MDTNTVQLSDGNGRALELAEDTLADIVALAALTRRSTADIVGEAIEAARQALVPSTRPKGEAKARAVKR